MDMNMFPELQSEYNDMAQSELPERFQTSSDLKRNAISFIPPSQYPQRKTMNPAKQRKIQEETDFTKGITIESILDPNFAQEKTSYYLTLRIKYQTALGESLCVVGEIEELGSWKNFDAKMKWTEGHIWVLENLFVKSKQFFMYKYVLMKNDKPLMWERGENRIADLRQLPDQNDQLLKNINIF